MGKTSNTKRGQRRANIQTEVKKRRRQWSSLSEEEKAVIHARQEILTARAEDELELFVHKVTALKQSRVSEAEVGHNDDIGPVLEFFRGGEMVCTVFCTQVNRDHGLEAAYQLAPALEADAVTMAVDAHYTNRMNDPRTGKPWEPHSMQNFCNEEGACDLGLITDCIYSMKAHRDGTFLWSNRPYHVHHASEDAPGEVVWIDEIHEGKTMPRFGGHDSTTMAAGQGMSGLVPDALFEALNQPSLEERLKDAATTEDEALKESWELYQKLQEDMDPEEVLAHRDCGVAKGYLTVHPGRYLVALASSPDNEVRRQIIEESMSRLPPDLTSIRL